MLKKKGIDKRNICRIVNIIFMLIIMAIIFYFSHQSSEASKELSQKVATTLQVETVNTAKYEEWGVPYNSASTDPLFAGLSLRKYAHIFLYALLGFSVFLVTKDFRGAISKNSLWAVIICFLYSCSDELHQHFVPGRTGSWKDVGVDAIGYGLAIAVCVVVYVVWRKRRKLI